MQFVCPGSDSASQGDIDMDIDIDIDIVKNEVHGPSFAVLSLQITGSTGPDKQAKLGQIRNLS